MKSSPLVSVIRLSGQIVAGQRGLSDERLSAHIERAFSKGKPAAVALVINSPGGSPVQSSLIAARIRRLAAEKNVPVIAFVEDIAASGGYWLASAADEIWSDEASILGSIGVISAGFGLDEFIGRHGVKRRVHTAGKSKSLLDPFQPEKAADVKRLRGMLDQMHAVFITQIKSRRAGKLSEEIDLFTGDVWIGQQAVEVGLADGIGHLVPVMKERFGDKVRFKVYGAKKGLFSRIGGQVAGDVMSELEERAEFARFGL